MERRALSPPKGNGGLRARRSTSRYGFVFSQQFRLEAFYDHALIDDANSGYEREPFQGVGIAGKTIGRNAQDGFVANVVFLKLF